MYMNRVKNGDPDAEMQRAGSGALCSSQVCEIETPEHSGKS